LTLNNIPVIWMWPKHARATKYNELLSEAIKRQGLIVKEFKPSSVFKMRRNHIYHVHWIQDAYNSKLIIIFLFKSIIFLSALIYLRLIGTKIVWTVHNVFPHEIHFKKGEKIIRSLFAKLCNALIIMGRDLKTIVTEQFGISPDKIYYIPHGHYFVYEIKGEDIRKKYQIANDAFVYLFFGMIRKYKGIDNLIKAFCYLNDPKTHLVIAGNPHRDIDIETLRKIAPRNSTIIDRFIFDDEVGDLLNAADALVLPYSEITTSGAAILGISYGKPVVAPDLGCLHEYVNNTCGVLYDIDDPLGLQKALQKVRLLDPYKVRKVSEEVIRNLDWNKIGQMYKDLYLSLIND